MSLASRRLSTETVSRLKTLVLRTAALNAFWSSKWQGVGLDVSTLQATSAEELLARLPFVTKAELVADQAAQPPYGSNLSVAAPEFTRLHQTSGTTTGQPLRWLDTPASWQWMMDCWGQLFRLAGLRPSDRLFFPFSFGPFLGFWAGFEGASRLGNFCLAGGGMASSARLKMLFENAITVVCCTPTYALRLAEVALEEGFDLQASSVRMLLVAGEPGGSVGAIRERIESLWNARVIDHWGMTEIGPLAIECSEQPGGLHVLESECIAEIIDPDSGAPAMTQDDGRVRGELVITNLGRVDSPLFRYRTGDLVEAVSRPCACGSSFLWLEGGILGRVDDMLIIRGNNVFPSSVEAILREFAEIVEYRITVRTERAMSTLRIDIEPSADCSDEANRDLLLRVQQAIKTRLNFVPEIEQVAPGSLPRFEMKGRRLVRENAPAG